jgi:hypothetical protein
LLETKEAARDARCARPHAGTGDGAKKIATTTRFLASARDRFAALQQPKFAKREPR